MKKTNGKLRRFINKIERHTDLLSFQRFAFEMNDEEGISIHGCRDISEYDSSKVAVTTDKFLINVSGENLKVENFSSDFTNICGKISGIEFSKIR